MAAARITWQAKVRGLLGERGGTLPRGAVPRLAKLLGRPRDVRKLRYWIESERSPIGETDVISAIAAALEVDRDWLLDGKDTPAVRTPRAEQIPQDVIRAVPAKFRRLAYAMYDDELAEFLLSQIDVYERLRRRARA